MTTPVRSINVAIVQRWMSVLLAVYGAALLAASPVCGYFADRSSSRRVPLLLGLVALASSTVMLCAGRSIATFVAGRILQGLSAAVVWSVGLALLADTSGKEGIGQAMGYVGVAMSLGLLLAPLLGGIVYARAGYVAVFGMAFGLIAVDILLRLAIIEKKIAKRWAAQDTRLSSGCSANGEGQQNHEMEENITIHNSAEEFDTPNEGSTVQGSHREQTQAPRENFTTSIPASTNIIRRLPPFLMLLSSRRLLASLWGSFVQSAVITGFDSTLPLFVSSTFGWDSTSAGLIFLPLIIPSFLGPVVGWATDKYGPRWLAAMGFLSSVPFLVLLRYVTYNSVPQKILLCALLFLIGCAMTLIIAPLMAEVMHVVDAKERSTPGLFGEKGAYAQAYGLFNLAFAGGALVGPILAGNVRQTSGWGTMGWSLGLLSGLSCFPVLFWAGGSFRKRRKSSRPASEGILSGTTYLE